MCAVRRSFALEDGTGRVLSGLINFRSLRRSRGPASFTGECCASAGKGGSFAVLGKRQDILGMNGMDLLHSV